MPEDLPMNFSLTQMMGWLVQYKYVVLFPIMIVEGPIITVIAGFLSSLGYLNLFVAYSVVVMGDVVGDSLYYLAGRWGRMYLFRQWGRSIGITMERMIQLQQFFTKHTMKTLIVGKLSHAIGAPVLVAAGMAHIPYWKFLGINFLATLPKSLLLLLIGFYFGQGYAKIDTYLDYTALGTVVLAMLLLLCYPIIKRFVHTFFTRE
jgi:membrane protein DedA with SNARE-associated domain